MDNNIFYLTVSKTKVVLAICFVQLVQVEMKCWIDDGARNEKNFLPRSIILTVFVTPNTLQYL